MKRLIFKRGIKKIVFPIHIPLGDFLFKKFAQEKIEDIKNRYKPRKNISWGMTISYGDIFCNVTATKIK